MESPGRRFERRRGLTADTIRATIRIENVFTRREEDTLKRQFPYTVIEGKRAHEARVAINSDADIATARSRGRELAEEVGFSGSALAVIATAISEIARNIIEYAGTGEISLKETHQGGRKGISVVARDHGPGIPDVELAMQDGFSTAKGIGLGLPGARRLMDEFEVNSQTGKGTTVSMKKWVA
jgi:serine/threonine-protein kinase RsbT